MNIFEGEFCALCMIFCEWTHVRPENLLARRTSRSWRRVRSGIGDEGTPTTDRKYGGCFGESECRGDAATSRTVTELNLRPWLHWHRTYLKKLFLSCSLSLSFNLRYACVASYRPRGVRFYCRDSCFDETREPGNEPFGEYKALALYDLQGTQSPFNKICIVLFVFLFYPEFLIFSFHSITDFLVSDIHPQFIYFFFFIIPRSADFMRLLLHYIRYSTSRYVRPGIYLIRTTYVYKNVLKLYLYYLSKIVKRAYYIGKRVIILLIFIIIT